MHFLAQCAIESDCFSTVEENRNADGSIPVGWNRYDGGSFYHGRGLIQITHNHRYSAYLETVGLALSNENVELLSNDLHHIVYSSVWYWVAGSAWGDIRSFADDNDFLKVTISVNGGYNHVKERNESLLKLRSIISCDNVNFTNMIFKGYLFSESGIRNTRWFRNNPSTVRSAEADLLEVQDV